MVQCDHCHQEMPAAISCTHPYLVFVAPGKDPEVLQRKVYPFDEQCRDCGVKHNGIHHFGCAMESCPKCGKQLIACGCFSGGDLWVSRTPALPKNAQCNTVKSRPENISQEIPKNEPKK